MTNLQQVFAAGEYCGMLVVNYAREHEEEPKCIVVFCELIGYFGVLWEMMQFFVFWLKVGNLAGK
jgi:hypothetical protein